MRIGTLISGLLFVLAGTVFFLINLGYGSWAGIQQISKWWPLLLIIFGLGLFGQGMINRWLAYSLIMVSVLGVGGYMMMMDGSRDFNGGTVMSSLDISRQQYPLVEKGDLTLDFGGGRIFIEPSSGELIKGNFSGETKQNILDADQNLKVHLSQMENSWLQWQKKGDRWKVQLSPELVWDMTINAGAVDGDIDLTGIPLKQLGCTVGAGNMKFTLDQNGDKSQMNIDAGASNIELQISADTGVSIELNGALSANNLDELGWIKTGKRYMSPNYEQASSKVDCVIHLSAGNLEVSLVPGT